MYGLIEWAQLLNLLLIPLGIAAWRMADRLARIDGTLTAHAQLSQERFDTMRHDLRRVEETANAAHRRIDQWHGPAPH